MRWYEGKIDVASENADIVAARLLDFGIEGVEIIDEYENMKFIEGHPSNWDYVEDALLDVQKEGATVKFYMPKESACGIMDDISHTLLDFGQASFSLVEDDWSEAWKAHYKPFKLGDKIMIVPSWEDYVPCGDEIVFRIDPGHVFGTGQHQSTALCIAALEKHVAQGTSVLDIGCGSGILSIISLLLGTKSATAIDIDSSAEKVCLENARLNNISPERYNVMTGNVLADAALADKLAGQKYDIVVANIIADVIIPLAPIAKRLLDGGGVFITSGIIKDRCDEVLLALQRAGFEIKEVATQDEWVAVVACYA
ncbi:MAG: 50S ribosomal protein L11 methyltransferase [Defluviitaleaceae bacterium]|nr:50S ribosomal protein L11 methyltransferase [Defluviitaleaceae bacterium]